MQNLRLMLIASALILAAPAFAADSNLTPLCSSTRYDPTVLSCSISDVSIFTGPVGQVYVGENGEIGGPGLAILYEFGQQNFRDSQGRVSGSWATYILGTVPMPDGKSINVQDSPPPAPSPTAGNPDMPMVTAGTDEAEARRRLLLNIMYGHLPANPTPYPQQNTNEEPFRVRVNNSAGGVRGSIDMPGVDYAEGSPAFDIFAADFSDIAAGEQLQFDFAWENAGDGDWFGLYFDDLLLWSSYGQTFEEGLLYTALFDSDPVAGKTGYLTIFLHSAGERNANLFVPTDYPSALDQSVPEPTSWALMLLGFCAIGAAMRRKLQVRSVCEARLTLLRPSQLADGSNGSNAEVTLS
jgi:hypothetical protein